MNQLFKKLQIKPGKCWLFFDAPVSYLETLGELPEGLVVKTVAEGTFDGVQLFVTNSVDLAEKLKIIMPVLKPDTVFWVTYPKKSSGIGSDLGMTGNWDALKIHGLRPVASAAINDAWTATRLKFEGQAKVSEFRYEAIKTNEYSAFIDVENREITLPPDMKVVLEQASVALAFYQNLSFTNKKEYVVWILSAKQTKTREDRLARIAEKLSSGKKNPSEK